MLDGTPESTQECPHKSRMTLMSPKECEIVWCIPYQIEMMPDSHFLDLEKSPIPNHRRQVAGFLQATLEVPLDTHLKSRGTQISTEDLEESSMDAISC